MAADLLSEYGEGYCGACRFIVGLDPGGRLNVHQRGVHDVGTPLPCPGGGRHPTKRVPYHSRKAAFRTEGQKAACPACGVSVGVRHGVIAGDRLRWHLTLNRTADCKGTNALVKEGVARLGR
jgi:hypothetical protein